MNDTVFTLAIKHHNISLYKKKKTHKNKNLCYKRNKKQEQNSHKKTNNLFYFLYENHSSFLVFEGAVT